MNDIKNKGQARLFQNGLMEYLTKTHPLVIWALYLPVIIFFFLHFLVIGQSYVKALSVYFAGILFWTFFEYLMHRYVFHWAPGNKKLQRIIYVLHGNHHEFPRDQERLFMPPLPSIIIASVLFFICYGMMNIYAFAFFPGFLSGYLLYGSLHFAIHAGKPPYSFLKPLWRHHHLHHYKSGEKGYGVSSPLWDIIFQTNFEKQSPA